MITRTLGAAVGPLAIAGFFLPWAHGGGILAGTQFTGFSLVRFTSDLQDLDLSLAQGAALWLTRLAILAVPVAGAWQTLLAPRWSWHPGYRLSGWYLVAFAVAAGIAGILRSSLATPPTGLLFVFFAASLFLFLRLLEHATTKKAGSSRQDPRVPPILRRFSAPCRLAATFGRGENHGQAHREDRGRHGRRFR